MLQWFVDQLEFTKVKIFEIIKWDIEKLKYEKWSKYRFKPRCIVLGTPKKPEKGQELTYPRQELTFMFKSIEI